MQLSLPALRAAAADSGWRSTIRGSGRCFLQLAGTLLILVAVPGSALKAALLLPWWWWSFRGFSPAEALFFLLINPLFVVLNHLSIGNGVFAFAERDILRQPWYECFMWGFYLLHLRRVFAGAPRPRHDPVVWPLVVAFALCFALIRDGDLLLLATAACLALALWRFHRPTDLAATCYLIFVGALIEYAGVWSGEWRYPDPPVGGVPIWFVTLWGGVGLFMHRLGPLLIGPVRGRTLGDLAGPPALQRDTAEGGPSGKPVTSAPPLSRATGTAGRGRFPVFERRAQS